jgi:hypothetical protein
MMNETTKSPGRVFYAWYSQKQAEQKGCWLHTSAGRVWNEPGSWYLSTDGDEALTTEIKRDDGPSSSRWDDLVRVGTVTKWLRKATREEIAARGEGR